MEGVLKLKKMMACLLITGLLLATMAGCVEKTAEDSSAAGDAAANTVSTAGVSSASTQAETFEGSTFTFIYPPGWAKEETSGAVGFEDGKGNTISLSVLADAGSSLGTVTQTSMEESVVHADDVGVKTEKYDDKLKIDGQDALSLDYTLTTNGSVFYCKKLMLDAKGDLVVMTFTGVTDGEKTVLEAAESIIETLKMK